VWGWEGDGEEAVLEEAEIQTLDDAEAAQDRAREGGDGIGRKKSVIFRAQ
jgi:hypothetical protein